MKERSIILRDAEVRGVIAGTKTRHAMPVWPQPDVDGLARAALPAHHWEDTSGRRYRCPLGMPGDRLCVREAWGLTKYFNTRTPSPRSDGGWKTMVRYGADEVHEGALLEWGRWRSPIAMPRWASRITLENTSVRVVRLHDISEDDADEEGILEWDGALDEASIAKRSVDMKTSIEDCRVWLAEIWDIKYGKKAPWSSNPWAWVVELRRIQ